jgi:methionine synthase I (cobalamin-dependent)
MTSDTAPDPRPGLSSAIGERLLIADGAMGSMLQGMSTDALIAHHPEARYFST